MEPTASKSTVASFALTLLPTKALAAIALPLKVAAIVAAAVVAVHLAETLVIHPAFGTARLASTSCLAARTSSNAQDAKPQNPAVPGAVLDLVVTKTDDLHGASSCGHDGHKSHN